METSDRDRRRGPVRPAAAVGSFWGLATYGVLWEGTPVEVSRAFVASPIGSLLLLPARLVIWGILGTEAVLGRTFDLSTTYGWIAPAAMAVGAGIGAAVVASASALVRRTRAPRDHSPL
ncbi:MAG: hypothetical protein ACKOKE_07585 [Actinomycetota bacterium]